MVRGFEVCGEEYRKHLGEEIELPIRGDRRSAGYDIKTPCDIVLQPNERKLVFTDVCAYMLDDEVLELYVRSSIGVKYGVVLSNGTGIIDSSYYPRNIGLPLWNTSDKVVEFKKGERIAQGIFKKYLVTDDDNCLKEERDGGFGSSGK